MEPFPHIIIYGFKTKQELEETYIRIEELLKLDIIAISVNIDGLK